MIAFERKVDGAKEGKKRVIERVCMGSEKEVSEDLIIRGGAQSKRGLNFTDCAFLTHSLLLVSALVHFTVLVFFLKGPRGTFVQVRGKS